MKKLRVPVILAAAVLAAGILALAGCGNGSTDTTVEGANIEPWILDAEDFDDISSDGFSILMTARVASPNPGGQVVEYAASKTTTAPSAANQWQPGRSFTGLDSGTRYYVFARAAEIKDGSTTYSPGTPRMALTEDGDPATVTTDQDDVPASISSSWQGIASTQTAFDVYGESDSVNFSLDRANSVESGKSVQYAITVGNSTPPAENAWQTSRSFRQTIVTNATAQLYAWARTAPSAGVPAGAPRWRRLELPGPDLSFPNGFTVTPGSITSNRGILTFSGSFPEKSPDFTNLSIEYAVGDENNAPTAASAWHPLQGTGTVTFTDLASGRPYYLWARTSAAEYNFREGEPARYDYAPQGHVFRTLGDVTNAAALAQTLLDLGGVVTRNEELVVLTSGSALLATALQIPDGVTLHIDGGTLDANHSAITGGGKIVVSSGKLTIQQGLVSIPSVTVNEGGSYSVATTTTQSGTQLFGPSGIIELKESQVMIQYRGFSSFYTLDPTIGASPAKQAEIKGNFSMDAGETFTVRSGAVLKFATSGNLSGAGRLDILSGGKLEDGAIAYFNGLVVGGQVVIQRGAYANLGTIKIGYQSTDAATSGDIEIQSSPTNGNVTITRVHISGSTWATHLSLTGYAVLQSSSNNLDIKDHVFNINNGSTLYIPAITTVSPVTAKELKVISGATLNVNGTLDIQEPTSMQTAGKLTNIDGFLNVGGIVYARKGSNFTMINYNSGSATVTSTGRIHVYEKALINGDTTLNGSGNITLYNGSEMEINKTNGKVKGGGTITVNGTLKVNDAGLSPFLTAGSLYTGAVTVSGAGGKLMITPNGSYATYISSVATELPAFLLGSGASMAITVNATPSVPVYTIGGTVSVPNNTGTPPPPPNTQHITSLYGNARLVVPNGATLNFPDHYVILELNGSTPASTAELHVRGGTLTMTSTISGAWAGIKGSDGQLKKTDGSSTPPTNLFFGATSGYETQLSTIWNTPARIPVIP